MHSTPHGRPRILLAHSYYLRRDPKQLEKMKPYPPLATLLAAAVLRERGHDVALFDAMLAPDVAAFEAALDAADPAIVAMVEDNFNFLTKMCTLRMRRAAAEMIGMARARGCKVAVNGSDAADHPEIFLDAGADVVIAGDVETTLPELAALWAADASAPLDSVRGLVLPAPERSRALAVHDASGASGGDLPVNGAGRVRRTLPRPPLEELDPLPFPAWDLIDAERYRGAWREAHGRLSWNMVTSRGCPYGCNWCAKPLFGRRYLQRSPADAAEELRRLRDAVAPDHVWFADDIFGLTGPWIEAFAEEVTRRGARTPFTIQSRANLMKPRAVAALAAAGAEEVWLGVESGSQKILDAMEKGTRVEQIREATRTLRQHGIRSGWFIQLGYLGETWEDLLRTRDLIRDERPDEIGVSVSYPLPGTKFYDNVREQLGAKRNWEHTDDLDMMFQGTFPSEFYRRVRRVLHDEVDAYNAGRESGFAEAWAALAEEAAAAAAVVEAGGG